MPINLIFNIRKLRRRYESIITGNSVYLQKKKKNSNKNHINNHSTYTLNNL